MLHVLLLEQGQAKHIDPSTTFIRAVFESSPNPEETTALFDCALHGTFQGGCTSSPA
jgi:hypothetical protein